MKRIIMLILVLLMLVSCGKQGKGIQDQGKSVLKDRRKPLAWGQRQKIFVFADDEIWRYAEDILRQTIERTFYTTLNEKMFVIERVPFSKLEDFFKFNNLIFYCDASSERSVSQYVKERLGEKLNSEIAENGGAIFPVFNLWADDQLVLFITGESEESLLKLNILQANEVWELFRQRLYKRLEFQLYRGGIKPESNYKDKVWKLDLPDNFMAYKTDIQNNFSSYLARSKSQPDMYISVYSEQMQSDSLSRSWLIDKRNEIAGHYYDGDKADEQDVMSCKTKIAGYDGLKITGRWQNDKYAVGGAFSCFAFHVPAGNQVFLIDNSVYYPEGDKLPALIKLEIISNSFKLK